MSVKKYQKKVQILFAISRTFVFCEENGQTDGRDKKKYTFIFCTLVKAELLIRRRSSERLENDLSVRLILMSTDRLSLRSNALMIMDHLYRILHFPPKNIRSKLLSIPRRGALRCYREADFKISLFSRLFLHTICCQWR